MIATVNALTIAGFDPSAGAGVLTDVRTFAAHAVDGCAVVTAITAQNARSVDRVAALDAELVRAQIDTLLTETPVSATKIGMLASADVVRCVASAVHRHDLQNVVVDPVLRATAGPALLDADALDVLRNELFACATVITPNANEAGVLLARPAPRTVRELREAALALRRFGDAWVLVKGGHADPSDACVDVLCGRDEILELRVPRVHGPSLHGTGCMLSSAIAAQLALGASVIDACSGAQRYVAAQLEAHALASNHLLEAIS